MAWVGTNSTNVQVQTAPPPGASFDGSRGGHVIWAAKEALKEAGWRLMSYGTGTGGTYVAPNVNGITPVADGLTTPTTLCGSGSWVRMKEPGSTTSGRELIFQCANGGAAQGSVVYIKYSRVGGFTLAGGGAVGVDRSPTAPSGEGKVIFMPYTAERTDAATTLSGTGAGQSPAISPIIGGYVQAVASDTPDANGVWPFYLWWYPSSGVRDTASYLFGIDSLILGSHHPDDDDPCCLLKVRLDNIVGIASTNTTQTGPYGVSYWHGYGLQGGVWVHNGQIQLPGASYTGSGTTWNHLTEGLGSEIVSVAADTASPYDGKVKMLPIGYAQGVTTGVLPSRWKGLSANVMVFNTSESALRVFNGDTDNPRISLLVSHTNAANPMGLVVPWVSGKEPAG